MYCIIRRCGVSSSLVTLYTSDRGTRSCVPCGTDRDRMKSMCVDAWSSCYCQFISASLSCRCWLDLAARHHHSARLDILDVLSAAERVSEPWRSPYCLIETRLYIAIISVVDCGVYVYILLHILIRFYNRCTVSLAASLHL